MEDKKQDVKSLEWLVKEANAYSWWFANLSDELSKVLADIKAPKQEDTWEMKCPYEYGNKYYFLQSSGDSFLGRWDNIEADNRYFSQGNIFPTEEAAELESKRRNLLTRFRAFRDECNGDWKADFENPTKEKFSICFYYKEFRIQTVYNANDFAMFGYFKNKKDCERAIELFGDEIKTLFVDYEEE